MNEIVIIKSLTNMKKHNTSYARLGDFAPKVTSPNKIFMALEVAAVITLACLSVIAIGEIIIRI